MRDGQVAFDLPRAEVSDELLRRLYVQHEDELSGPAPAAEDAPVIKTVAMHCR
jgi:phosphonate transport system ATP-binding protein